MRLIKWFVAGLWPMILLATVNLGLLIVYGLLSSRASVYTSGQIFPTVSGIRLDGSTFLADPSPCYVLRVTADDCAYCKRDRPFYFEVLRAARGTGCEVVSVAPQAGQMEPAPGEEAQQLKFVEMEFGETLNPYLTPQTIVLDSHRRVIWQQQGALNERALRAGVAAIKSLTTRTPVLLSVNGR